MEKELVFHSQGNRIEISRAATEKDRFDVARQFGYGMLKQGTIYVARVNGQLAGFAGYLDNALIKIEVSKSFRNFGPISEKLLGFSVNDYFARNRGMREITFNASSQVRKKQKALERWYGMKGALRNPAMRGAFYFTRPKAGETLLQARARETKKMTTEWRPPKRSAVSAKKARRRRLP